VYYEKKIMGQIAEIETQVHYDLKVNGVKITGHRPDFRVTYKDGTQEIREFKGFSTEAWLIKKALFEALYPEIPYKVFSQKDLW